MKLSRHYGRAFSSLAALVAVLFSGGVARAQNRAYQTIHEFQGGSDGSFPSGVPAVAKNGELYGVTENGGTYNSGTIFKLIPPQTSGGAWAKSVTYEFPGGKGEEGPQSVIFGADGNLYGVNGGETIYELKAPDNDGGVWKYSALHTLNQGSGGGPIQGNLAFDSEGNLYGATELGGDLGACHGDGCGTVFELKRPTKSGGKWRFSLLYTFTGGTDGAEPFAGVTLDQKGNVYGTTDGGGIYDFGTAYRFSPPVRKGHAWTETVLYSFDRSANIGSMPGGPVIFDGAGNMYGTTVFGGDLNCSGGFGCGVVFELSPPAQDGQTWTYATLYAFQGGDDGSTPTGYMVFDQKGNLYSTTQTGGGGNGGYAGIAFRLSPPAQRGDAWTETVLHRFQPPGGVAPNDGLTFGRWGDLYGVTWYGGHCQECGTVFEVRP